MEHRAAPFHQPVPVTAKKPSFAQASTAKEESVTDEREAYRARPSLKKKELTSV